VPLQGLTEIMPPIAGFSRSRRGNGRPHSALPGMPHLEATGATQIKGRQLCELTTQMELYRILFLPNLANLGLLSRSNPKSKQKTSSSSIIAGEHG